MIKTKGVESATEELKEFLLRIIQKLRSEPAIINAESSLLNSNQNNDSQLSQAGIDLFSLLYLANAVSSYVSTVIIDSAVFELDGEELVQVNKSLRFDTHCPFLEKETVDSLQAIEDSVGLQERSDGLSFCSLKRILDHSQLPYLSLTDKRDCLIRVNSLLANDTKGLALLSKLKTHDCFDKDLVWAFIEGEFCYELVIKLIEELGVITIARLLTVRYD